MGKLLLPYLKRFFIPSLLERWALDIAKPYLLQHSHSLTVDTTDPRQARRVYDEPDLMEVDADNDENTKKSAAVEDTWTTESKKNKRTPPPDATSTPLPDTPPRTPTTTTTQQTTVPPTTVPTTQTPTAHLKNTQVNDGTLRVTVRWKPTTYTELNEDEDAWNLAATD